MKWVKTSLDSFFAKGKSASEKIKVEPMTSKRKKLIRGRWQWRRKQVHSRFMFVIVFRKYHSFHDGQMMLILSAWDAFKVSLWHYCLTLKRSVVLKRLGAAAVGSLGLWEKTDNKTPLGGHRCILSGIFVVQTPGEKCVYKDSSLRSRCLSVISLLVRSTQIHQEVTETFSGSCSFTWQIMH